MCIFADNFLLMAESAVFTQQFDIQSHHIGPNAEVNLQYLLGCMQTTADMHVDSRQIGWNDLHAKGCFWAIYRMGLQIERLPRKYDRITVNTWANPPKGVFQPRSFEVFDQHGNRLLRAQSLWLVLDDKEFRPQQVEQIIGTDLSYLIGAQDSFDIPLKVPMTTGEPIFPMVERTVLYSDIDTNHHVNNTNYVRWLIDSIPADYLKSHQIRELILNYVLQARLGDRYAVSTIPMTDGRLNTTIKRADSDEEFCKITTRWAERSGEMPAPQPSQK